MPGVGSTVLTRRGQGRVTAQELLARKVLVQYEDNRLVLTDLAEVVTVVSRGRKPTDEE
jgi:hypothetical protein